MNKTVILTGLRANNDLHLGNYLGALLPIVKLQQEYSRDHQINLFVPDLHSFTTPIDHSKLYEQTMHNLKLFVASGLKLNDKNTYVYRQSRIPAHSELTIILNCFAYMGELSRMTQYKEKASNSTSVSVGLFDYPVLMAADILLYGAKYIPVGDDQSQHVELARDIAIRLNNKFKKPLFVLPEAEKQQVQFANQQKRIRIKDLLNPDKKMSKSDASGKGVIFLGDNPVVASKKIMSATTDSINKINYDPVQQPGVSNLIDIYAALSNKSVADILKVHAGKTQYGALKKEVAEVVKEFLTDFQARLNGLDSKVLQEKLKKSENAMNIVANETLRKVQVAVGLRNS